MGKLETGFTWVWHKDKATDEILNYLIDKGWCTFRADIAKGFLCLAQEGKAALHAERQERYKMRLTEQHRAEDMRYHDAEKKSDRKFQAVNTIISALVGSLLTLLVEHFDEVTQWLASLF